MASSAGREPPQRTIIPGVPGFKYMRDGMCPCALCLKSLTEFMGKDHTYTRILGASGAAFRMAWNHTEWDEGNMDLGRLGPEVFRQGLRAVGLRGSFLVRESWWPGVAAKDIQVLPDDASGEAFSAPIMQSINEGAPVLVFGAVGPPEVSIITGYDDGGGVMIGWSAHQNDLPPDQIEPNGAFRERDWAAKTRGIVLIEPLPEPPDTTRLYRDAIEWAYQVTTLPRSASHIFGAAAYRGWAEAMVRDVDFRHDVEGLLSSRKFTVWDGLIMTHERNAAGEFLDEAAVHLPELAERLHEAARLCRRESEDGGAIARALGGPMLPPEFLADPVARRDAIDAIHAARETHLELIRQLALATGRASADFDVGGPVLPGLRPARRWLTLLGCIQGCLRYLGLDVEEGWLWGITGAAFMLNIDERVDVSGPSSWDFAGHFTSMTHHLGVRLTEGARGEMSDPDLPAKQAAARAFIRGKLVAGIPCFAWNGFPEYVTVNGCNGDGLTFWTHFTEEGYGRVAWDQLGRNETECFAVFSVERVEPPADDREAIRAALKYALSLRSPVAPPAPNRAQGLPAYGLWISNLQSGDWLKSGYPGVHHNVVSWHECRCYAEAFLRLAGEKIGGDLQPRFETAADHYRGVRMALLDMQPIFADMQTPDEEGIARAEELLRKARDEEMDGLAAIEEIVDRL